MSLRDQLLKSGLVSKKDVRKVEHGLREQRKQEQGSRRRAAELEAERVAKEQAEKEAAQRQKAEERRRREATRAEIERNQRIRALVRGNQIRSRGPFRFFHRTLGSNRLGRLEISERVAWKLRCGECAIAALADDPERMEYVVISARAAQRLAELAPERLVFWTRDTSGLSDLSECLWKPEWEISLRPHRLS